jgi:beta-lactamase superfamily II metal-dependent hydrolase
MSQACVINVDLADVWGQAGRKQFVRTLSWGDQVTVTGQTTTRIEIETVSFKQEPDGSLTPVKEVGFLEPAKSSGIKAAEVVRPRQQNEVLKVDCVDVQQGDGAVIESPDGKVILVDGGDNQLFARYLAARFRGTTAQNPKEIDCILVTHGDADHFDGMAEVFASETLKEKRKRLFIQPRRCYHNGIVKRPSEKNGKRVPDVELLGATRKAGGTTFLTGLEEDLLAVPDAEMNKPFKKWKAALAAYDQRSKVTFRRLQFGDDQAFSFFNQGDLEIQVLGPLVELVAGKPALRFLGDPPKGPRIGHESLSLGGDDFKGHSASHTINGHSVVFRLAYGGFSYLFCGDLNDEASRFLTREHNAGRLNLRAEVFKVPHHGSADFSGAMLQAVSPIVSIVSSGDESAQKEYIHPRATLMGALGKWSRVAEPLVFVTELVAFFNVEGWSKLSRPKTRQEKARGEFFGFSRSAFGIVKTRTDGKRLLVCTDSAIVDMKEAYAYALDTSGAPQPSPVLRA